ncbi:alpha/beta fold hydrolase [Acidisphaera sp. L21]|uniref:alpha/beta fold hydrolase n=1 Tax=Acidisphaera sp. L21 TaxID=1641851 RepID=UPI00131D9E95|nr:alpha/beta hydrolase [Acidisphaera sp. L21]
MRRCVLSLLLVLSAVCAQAAPPWQTLPPTPAAIPTSQIGDAPLDGIRIHYAVYGNGAPVILLHGGLANADYWGDQIPALARHHMVIVMDSRGHGRSTADARPYGYDLMTDDVIALLDLLKLPKVDVVGWSDGAIIGLDMALRYPARTGRVFAFAANTDTSGVKPNVGKNPVFAAYIARAGHEYAALSPTPHGYKAFVTQISKMWAQQPHWTDATLRTIKSPVLVVDGDHDEAINRTHTEHMAATIPGARLLILPNVSHFAFLQNSAAFNAAILGFLSD